VSITCTCDAAGGPELVTVIVEVRFAPGAARPLCVSVIDREVAVTVVAGLDVPVIEAVTVSVAVMVCAPAVFSVAWNVPTPLVNVALPGGVAAASVVVNFTVPA
jgi:hypothetical protein